MDQFAVHIDGGLSGWIVEGVVKFTEQGAYLFSEQYNTWHGLVFDSLRWICHILPFFLFLFLFYAVHLERSNNTIARKTLYPSSQFQLYADKLFATLLIFLLTTFLAFLAFFIAAYIAAPFNPFMDVPNHGFASSSKIGGFIYFKFCISSFGAIALLLFVFAKTKNLFLGVGVCFLLWIIALWNFAPFLPTAYMMESYSQVSNALLAGQSIWSLDVFLYELLSLGAGIATIFGIRSYLKTQNLYWT